MAKLGKITIFGPAAESNGPALKKQSRYGPPWTAGEIPNQTGSLIPIFAAHDQSAQPYGEFMGIQKPANIGKGYSPINIVDLEGNETKRKQK